MRCELHDCTWYGAAWLICMLDYSLLLPKKPWLTNGKCSRPHKCCCCRLLTGRRRQSLFANTFFLGVVYHPDESQIVTAGTDRKVNSIQTLMQVHLCLALRPCKLCNCCATCCMHHPQQDVWDATVCCLGYCVQITYWDAYDGQAIRIIEGSDSAQLNALATDPEGEALLSGGSDKLVKLWG